MSEDTVSRGVFEQVMWERDVAIEQLKELGYVFGEKIRTDDDSISRQAVLDLAVKIELPDSQTFFCISPEDVEELPSVTPKQRTGHWIIHDESITLPTGGTATGGVICSKCGYKTHNKGHAIVGCPYNYCPSCGARMVEPQESENK